MLSVVPSSAFCPLTSDFHPLPPHPTLLHSINPSQPPPVASQYRLCPATSTPLTTGGPAGNKLFCTCDASASDCSSATRSLNPAAIRFTSPATSFSSLAPPNSSRLSKS